MDFADACADGTAAGGREAGVLLGRWCYAEISCSGMELKGCGTVYFRINAFD